MLYLNNKFNYSLKINYKIYVYIIFWIKIFNINKNLVYKINKVKEIYFRNFF